MLWQEKMLGIFEHFVKFTPEARTDLAARWRRSVSLKRNDFLIRHGQIETSLFFIESGALRLFYPHKDEEICVGFAYDGNLICSYPSFILNKPSDYAIQALRTTKASFIQKNEFYQLFESHPCIERAWRMIQEQALVGKIERETEMLTFTPEERFQRLMKRSPHLLQIIPKKYIASYLRMSPETLSRMKY